MGRCRRTTWVSESKVLCTAPAGVGTHLPVAVKTEDFPEAETFGSKSQVTSQHRVIPYSISTIARACDASRSTHTTVRKHVCHTTCAHNSTHTTVRTQQYAHNTFGTQQYAHNSTHTTCLAHNMCTQHLPCNAHGIFVYLPCTRVSAHLYVRPAGGAKSDLFFSLCLVQSLMRECCLRSLLRVRSTSGDFDLDRPRVNSGGPGNNRDRLRVWHGRYATGCEHWPLALRGGFLDLRHLHAMYHACWTGEGVCNAQAAP